MSSILRQRGLSLIEILLSLAIISVILMMIVNYYSTQNKDQLLVSKAAAQIQQLASVSYEWQTAQSKMDFTGISLTVLQDAGLLSATDNYSQKSPWGGGINITAENSNPQYVLITLDKIPRSACANLRERMSQVAHSQSSSNECAQGSYYISL
jgi:prepilin-type N-terminal cleavage/methylation domain-containing protein